MTTAEHLLHTYGEGLTRSYSNLRGLPDHCREEYATWVDVRNKFESFARYDNGIRSTVVDTCYEQWRFPDDSFLIILAAKGIYKIASGVFYPGDT